MRIFDCQSHVFPPGYAEIIKKNKGLFQATTAGTAIDVTIGAIRNFRINVEGYDISKKIADKDRHGIDVSLLSINIPGPDLLDPELQDAGARICNDYVAGLVAAHPDRFLGLAVLPWMDPEAAQRELRRISGELDLRGVVLYSHLGGRSVDDALFAGTIELAQELNLPLVLHPSFPTWSDAILDYSMVPMLGFMVDTSIAMLRLILSGTMERLPELKVLHPHCGGVLPYLMPRVVEQTERKGRGREHIQHSPDTYYKRVFLDLASPSVDAARYAIEFAGVDHCVFGSDHPWVDMELLLDCVTELPIGNNEKQQILFDNAARLFGLL